ncbi:MAG: glycosyltransferase [bacterium]|nr:glycosyltransferase [bacterium]
MNILFITPYLPVTGLHAGGVRMHALIRELSRRHRIFLVSVADDEHLARIDQVRPLCAEVRTVPTALIYRRLPVPPTLLPDLIWFEWSCPLVREEIRRVLARRAIDLVAVEYEVMAHFLPRGYPSVLTVHELQSFRAASVRRHAGDRRRARLLREEITWRRFEDVTFGRFGRLISLTPEERETILRRQPWLRIDVVPTGADGSYFRPLPDAAEEDDCVFIGSFGHLPNADAARHFCREILPLVRRDRPGAAVAFVGNGADRELDDLRGVPGVRVVGRVDDIRPSIARGRIFVNPVRLGGGMRGKLQEAFAMGRAVVTTSLGAHGMEEYRRGGCVRVADGPADFARAVLELLGDDGARREMGRRARRLFEGRYDWRILAGGLDRTLEAVREEWACARGGGR